MTCVVSFLLTYAKGLAGKDAFENAEIASVGDAITDLSRDIVKIYYEKDEGKKVFCVQLNIDTVHVILIVPRVVCSLSCSDHMHRWLICLPK